MKIGMKILAMAFIFLAAVSCGDSKDDGGDGDYGGPRVDAGTINGSWKLSSWGGSTAMAGKVYLQLNSDHSFALYQSINEPGFKKLTGTYLLEQNEQGNKFLSGKYTDKTVWSSGYLINKHTDAELSLKSLTDKIISEYVAAQIPDDVVNARTTASRAATEKPFL